MKLLKVFLPLFFFSIFCFKSFSQNNLSIKGKWLCVQVYLDNSDKANPNVLKFVESENKYNSNNSTYCFTDGNFKLIDKGKVENLGKNVVYRLVTDLKGFFEGKNVINADGKILVIYDSSERIDPDDIALGPFEIVSISESEMILKDIHPRKLREYGVGLNYKFVKQ